MNQYIANSKNLQYNKLIIVIFFQSVDSHKSYKWSANSTAYFISLQKNRKIL